MDSANHENHAKTERRIRAEFENMPVDISNIISALEQTPVKKAKRFLGKSLVVSIAIMILMATAVTAGTIGYINSRRLADIIGEDRAARVTLVEFVDEGGYMSESMVTDCGLHIGLLATSIHGNRIDVYIMLQDLYKNRLDSAFHLNYTISPQFCTYYMPIDESEFSIVMMPRPFEVIDRNRSTGIVTLRSRIVFSRPLDRASVHLTLHNIYFNVERVRGHQILESLTGLNQTPETTIMRICEDYWPFTVLNRIHPEIAYSAAINYMIHGDGFPMLTPNQSNLQFEQDTPFSISSIAITDNRLHVQTVGPHIPYTTWTADGRSLDRIELFLRRGRRTIPRAGLGFMLDNQGGIVSPAGLHVNGNTGDYPHFMEYIFYVDTDYLEEYSLYGNFIFVDIIHIGQSTVLEATGSSIILRGLVIPLNPLNPDYVATHDVYITPVSIIVSSVIPASETDLRHYATSRNIVTITIHKICGGTVGVLSSASIMTDMEGELRINSQFQLRGMDYLDLSMVEYVEIQGEMIRVR